MMTSTSNDPDARSHDRWKLVEWAIAGASGIAILAIFGFLSAEALTASHSPPAFSTTTLSIREDQGLFYVAVAVTNNGDEAAADAVVKGILTTEGDERSASVTIDYVPANSQREATLVFTAPFDVSSLALLVEGYRAP